MKPTQLTSILLAFICTFSLTKKACAQSDTTKRQSSTIPQYIHGYAAMCDTLEKIIYPKASLAKKIEGKVVVEATITAEGKVQELKINKHLNEELDKEALRLVSKLKQWIPAQKSPTSPPETVKLLIPIRFQLPEESISSPQ